MGLVFQIKSKNPFFSEIICFWGIVIKVNSI